MDFKTPGTLEISIHQVEILSLYLPLFESTIFFTTTLGDYKETSNFYSLESKTFPCSEKCAFTKTSEELVKIECFSKCKNSQKLVGKIILPIQTAVKRGTYKLSVFLIGDKGKAVKLQVELRFVPDELFISACLILKNFGFSKKNLTKQIDYK